MKELRPTVIKAQTAMKEGYDGAFESARSKPGAAEVYERIAALPTIDVKVQQPGGEQLDLLGLYKGALGAVGELWAYGQQAIRKSGEAGAAASWGLKKPWPSPKPGAADLVQAGDQVRWQRLQGDRLRADLARVRDGRGPGARGHVRAAGGLSAQRWHFQEPRGQPHRRGLPRPDVHRADRRPRLRGKNPAPPSPLCPAACSTTALHVGGELGVAGEVQERGGPLALAARVRWWQGVAGCPLAALT
eukprot:scaffold131050_cov60-Phaeocystis_antarctica.AAC.1